MAGGDYKRCDVCGGKAFFDADLSYESIDEDYDLEGYEPVKEVGEVKRYSYSLQHLWDWAVLCQDCSKTHKCVIEKLQ